MTAFDRLDPRTAGSVMQGIAAAGVAVAVLGAVVGWSLLGRLDAAAGDTLDLTVAALVTIDDTIVVVDDVVTSTRDALEAVELTLGEVVVTAENTQPLLESLSDLSAEVAPNLVSAANTFRSLEQAGDTIDSLLSALDVLPGVPSYDPGTPLGEQFGAVADDIEPLAEVLIETSEQIGTTVDGTADLQDRVAELEQAVGAVRQRLERSDDLLSDYAATASHAHALAESTTDGLGRDLVAARVLMLLAAMTFAAAQIVPFWFGHELRARSRD